MDTYLGDVLWPQCLLAPVSQTRSGIWHLTDRSLFGGVDVTIDNHMGDVYGLRAKFPCE